MKTLFYFGILLFAFAMGFWSCQSNPLDIDISNSDVTIEYLSFEKELQKSTIGSPLILEELSKTYGTFPQDFVESILQIGPVDNPQSWQVVSEFATDSQTVTSLNAIAEVHHPNRNTYHKTLTEALQRYHYHFPEENLPRVITMHSGFNFSVFPYNKDHIAIGLDYFLGTEHPVTLQLDANLFPQYMKDKMKPEYVPYSAIRGWLLIKNQEHYDNKNLLSTLIYWGKIMYIMDACFPNKEDAMKMDYTAQDIAWCEANERSIWIELSQSETIYQNKRFEIEKWTAEGPFTAAADVPQDSPARLGIWMGWQIVRDYMEKNREITLEQLLEDRDYLKMLNTYKPG